MKQSRQELLTAMKNTRTMQQRARRVMTNANQAVAAQSARNTDKLLETMAQNDHPGLKGNHMSMIIEAWTKMRSTQKRYNEAASFSPKLLDKVYEAEKAVDDILLVIQLREPKPEPRQMEIDLGGHA